MKRSAKLIVLGLWLVVCLSASAQPPPAQLRVERQAGPIRIELRGEAGRDYSIEAADALATNGWSPLVTFSLSGDSQSWFDATSLQSPQRFYRALTFDGPAPVEVAPNFALIDHQGTSRELNYYLTDTNVAAFVLLFTANGCAAVRDFVPTINALRSQFEPRHVRFWMINPGGQDTRSNMVAEAAALGLTLPILHDRAQLATRAYRAVSAPAAVAVGRGVFPGAWTIFYRGAIDDRMDSNTNATTQSYLADALTSFLANGTVTLKRTPEVGCALRLPTLRPVSYTSDIAPLLQAKCAACHSPGNIAPWAMTNYDRVAVHALAMKEEVLAGRMPPWHADPEYGVFTNDFSLTPAEAAKLVQWIDDGAPRGEGPDPLADLFANAPPPTNYPFAWPAELGPPDAILTVPVQSIKATGIEDYRYINVPTSFPSNVWLRAAVMRPSNPRVVHHMTAVGSDSTEVYGWYNPGRGPTIFPPGTGTLLARGATLELGLHYITIGQPQTDQPQLGLYFTPNKPPLRLRLGYAGWAWPALNPSDVGVPPGAAEYAEQAEWTFPTNIRLYEFHPHMHLRGQRMKYEALYPDGTSEILLSVPRFSAHWETVYRFTEPKSLPAGTRLKVSGFYDNSPQNPENPDATATAIWGPQLTNEMFLGYVHYAELLTITAQPQSRSLVRGSTATFRVSASSPNGFISYQWQFNGTHLPGATNTSLTLTNAQPDQNGVYAVVVSDGVTTLTSQTATLLVGDRPVITQHPESQTARIGDNVNFSVSATGTPPLSYHWRKDNSTLLVITNNDTTATLMLTNVQTTHAGTYAVGVFNTFGSTPLSSNAVLTVVTP